MRSLKGMIMGMLLVWIMAVSPTIHAAPLNIVEGALPPPLDDFPGGAGVQPPTPNIGTLNDVGVHMVRGSLQTPDTLDKFRLTLTPGFLITGLDLIVSNFVPFSNLPNVTRVSSSIANTPQPPIEVQTQIEVPGNGTFSQVSLPYPGGLEYEFQTGLSGPNISPPAAADWKYNITVASTNPIPTPSAMLLMGTGLFGLIGWQRWRTKKD